MPWRACSIRKRYYFRSENQWYYDYSGHQNDFNFSGIIFFLSAKNERKNITNNSKCTNPYKYKLYHPYFPHIEFISNYFNYISFIYRINTHPTILYLNWITKEYPRGEAYGREGTNPGIDGRTALHILVGGLKGGALRLCPFLDVLEFRRLDLYWKSSFKRDRVCEEQRERSYFSFRVCGRIISIYESLKIRINLLLVEKMQ